MKSDTQVKLLLPHVGFELSHIRHFVEALNNCPGVQAFDPRYTGEVDVQFMIGGKADLTARLYRDDPHALAPECGCGLSPFLDENMLSCLAKAGLSQHEEYVRQRWIDDIGRMNLTPHIPELDKYDVVLVAMRSPYDTVLAPRLSHAKLLRVPPVPPGWIFYPPQDEAGKAIDVFFLGAVGAFYPLRMMMTSRLKDDSRLGKLVYHEEHRRPGNELLTFRHDLALFDAHQRYYAECLRHSKIFPMDGGLLNYPVQKYFEAMACGCLVVGPLPRDAELLGFRDGETMVACTADDFMDKIYYYLNHHDERRTITQRAYSLALTCESQAAVLVGKLQSILDGSLKPVDGWYE